MWEVFGLLGVWLFISYADLGKIWFGCEEAKTEQFYL